MFELIVVFVLVTLAVGRVTRVVTKDKIAEPVRNFILERDGKDGWFTYLIFCPMCVGVWVSAAAVPFVWFMVEAPDVLDFSSWLGVPVAVLAVSYVASLMVAND